jgi:hypothetical protein
VLGACAARASRLTSQQQSSSGGGMLAPLLGEAIAEHRKLSPVGLM